MLPIIRIVIAFPLWPVIKDVSLFFSIKEIIRDASNNNVVSTSKPNINETIQLLRISIVASVNI